MSEGNPPSRLRVSLAGGQWRDIEADDHELAGGILVFTLAGNFVLMVPLHALLAVEPAGNGRGEGR